MFVPPLRLLDLTVATTAANLNPGADPAGATPPPGQCAGSAEPGGGDSVYSSAALGVFASGLPKILPYCDGAR